ncbi:MAG TPA: cytochrome c [Burkholderiaceae bacterium]|jgi:cytochrome c556|nr:cytochrome c [Burkholderiaceae bacterium]
MPLPTTLKFRPSLAVAALALLAALPAAAQYRNADAAIKYRQSAMSLQNNHMGRIFAMVNGQAPFDAKVMNENIEIVSLLNTRAQFAAFIEGSDKGNTRAKPEIWTEKEKFSAAVAKSQSDVDKLVAAGKTGNLDQIKAAAGAVGQSCKACHDAYQKPQ